MGAAAYFFSAFSNERQVFAVAFLLELLDGDEAQRRPSSCSNACRRWPPGRRRRRGRGARRCPWSGPPCAPCRECCRSARSTFSLTSGLVKLGQPVPLSNLSIELNKGLAADHVHVDAGLVVVPVGVAERRLGAGLAGDAVLFGGEPLLEFFLGGFGGGVLSVVCMGVAVAAGEAAAAGVGVLGADRGRRQATSNGDAPATISLSRRHGPSGRGEDWREDGFMASGYWLFVGSPQVRLM